MRRNISVSVSHSSMTAGPATSIQPNSAWLASHPTWKAGLRNTMWRSQSANCRCAGPNPNIHLPSRMKRNNQDQLQWHRGVICSLNGGLVQPQQQCKSGAQAASELQQPECSRSQNRAQASAPAVAAKSPAATIWLASNLTALLKMAHLQKSQLFLLTIKHRNQI